MSDRKVRVKGGWRVFMVESEEGEARVAVEIFDQHSGMVIQVVAFPMQGVLDINTCLFQCAIDAWGDRWTRFVEAHVAKQEAELVRATAGDEGPGSPEDTGMDGAPETRIDLAGIDITDRLGLYHRGSRRVLN